MTINKTFLLDTFINHTICTINLKFASIIMIMTIFLLLCKSLYVSIKRVDTYACIVMKLLMLHLLVQPIETHFILYCNAITSLRKENQLQFIYSVYNRANEILKYFQKYFDNKDWINKVEMLGLIINTMNIMNQMVLYLQ